MGLIGAAAGAILGSVSRGSSSAGTKAAKIMNRELKRQYDITKAQFKPFMESGKRTLPGFVESATDFGASINAVQPALQRFLDPILRKGEMAAGDYMNLVGLDGRSDFAGEAAMLDPEQYLSLLLGSEQDLYQNRGNVVQLGLDKALELSGLGQDYASQIADNTIQGALTDAQTRTKNRQNIISGALTGAKLPF